MDDKLIQSLAQRESRIRHKQQMDKLASLENSVVSTMRQLVKFLDGKTTKTEVVNQLKSVSTPDIDKVVDALNKLDSNNAKNKLDLTPLKEELTKLGKKLDKLPTEFPELPEGIEEVTVKNQIDLEPLEKAIKGLKLEAPKVDVAAPNVQVDAPDLKPLQDSLLDVVKSIKAQKYPETDLTKVEKKLDEANKHLKKIVEKPVGGGGGGGMVSFKDSAGFSVQVTMNDDGTIPTASKATDRYAYSAKSETATYKYYFFEDKDGNWYILRKTLATEVVRYAKGTGGIDSVFDSSTTDPSGSVTFASYATTFN